MAGNKANGLAEVSFSVIIPCFNCEDTIRATINSILMQDYYRVEVICINDCSTDCTLQILNEYREKIVLLNNLQNEGQFLARNKGVYIAKNDFILFVDSDDLLVENTFSRLNEFINSLSDDFDFAVFGYKTHCSNQKFYPHKTDVLRAMLTKKNFSCVVWNKIYRLEFLKTVLQEIQNAYCIFAEDLFFNVFLCNRTDKIVYINECLYEYNDTKGISTSVYRRTFSELEKTYNSAVFAYNSIVHDVKNNNPKYKHFLPAFRIMFFKRIYNFIFSHTKYLDLKKMSNFTLPKKNLCLMLLHKEILLKQKIKHFLRGSV